MNQEDVKRVTDARLKNSFVLPDSHKKPQDNQIDAQIEAVKKHIKAYVNARNKK